MIKLKLRFFFLDKDWVKVIIFSFVAYWLYAILRFALLLRSYDFITNSSMQVFGIRLRLSNVIPYAVLFLILGQVLGIILKNRLITKSLLVGFMVTILVFLNFPLFFTVVFDIRGFFHIDNLYPCFVFPIGTLVAMAYRNPIIKRKGLRTGITAVVMAMFVFFSGSQAVILYRLHISKSDAKAAYKNDAEAFSLLLNSLTIPEKNWESIINDVEKYNVNNFFASLTHLRMEPGYALDYVYYHDDSSGFPVLYAHRSEDAAFKNYGEYRQARGEIGEDENWDRVYGRSGTKSDKNIFGYLDHVMIDDEPQGYFQYALLRIMGSQFYLFWHAGYSDKRPIFSYAQFREIMVKEKGWEKRAVGQDESFWSWSWLAFDPWILIHKAAELNFEPSIIMNKEAVEIKLVIFTDYGGLIQRTFLVSRAFPHDLLKEDQKTLVPYFWGHVF